MSPDTDRSVQIHGGTGSVTFVMTTGSGKARTTIAFVDAPAVAGQDYRTLFPARTRGRPGVAGSP